MLSSIQKSGAIASSSASRVVAVNLEIGSIFRAITIEISVGKVETHQFFISLSSQRGTRPIN